MRPLDPRLVRSTRAVRLHLVVTVGCGLALTGLILAQAWLVARVVAGAGTLAAADLATLVAAVAGVALARAVLATGAETAAMRSAARVKSDLRRRLVHHVTAGASPQARAARERASASEQSSTAPARSAGRAPARTGGELVTLATRGLDALDDYVARYLPQLVLAALVPLAVLVVVARADWVSALVIAVTLPLIPLFMALVGWHTQARTRRQWRLLERLGGHFLDVVEGLPTLAVFRRAKAEAALIRRVTEEHRGATMGTLRVAFLSALVLELLATLAVALVAVEIGLRLLYGRLDLETGLLVLILAPEAYLPLREVGARFHASTEGVAAAERVFAVLESGPGTGLEQRSAAAPPGPAAIRFSGVGLTYPGRNEPALAGVDLVLAPSTTTLLTGPSGAGKTSLLALLLRFAEPTTGRITVQTGAEAGHDLGELDPDDWRRRIAWLPQHPYLLDASVLDNIRLGAPEASDAAVRRAARLAEAEEVVAGLPAGYATHVGERGSRLSAGQRQRIALARAFLRVETAQAQGLAPLVLLDEPTAHLDPEHAAAVRAGAARLLRGRTGVVVAHDGGWTEVADEVVELTAPVLTGGAGKPQSGPAGAATWLS